MSARRLWIILFLLALLTPLGIWLPARLRAGGGWGEWSREEMAHRAGVTAPRGAAYQAPAPEYTPRGWPGSPVARHLGYALSAVIGVIVCAATVWLLTRGLGRKGGDRAP